MDGPCSGSKKSIFVELNANNDVGKTLFAESQFQSLLCFFWTSKSGLKCFCEAPQQIIPFDWNLVITFILVQII